MISFPFGGGVIQAFPMKRSVARAIVDGFRADGLVAALGPETCAYLRDKYRPIYCQRIRVMVGDMNRRAADLIWDGHPQAAVEALVKYGLRERADFACEPLDAVKYALKLDTGRMIGQDLWKEYRAGSGRNVSGARKGGFR